MCIIQDFRIRAAPLRFQWLAPRKSYVQKEAENSQARREGGPRFWPKRGCDFKLFDIC
jgi:hypothetical protein